jgi:hypothetical protein
VPSPNSPLNIDGGADGCTIQPCLQKSLSPTRLIWGGFFVVEKPHLIPHLIERHIN